MKILNKNVVILLLSCFCVLSINMVGKNENSIISEEMSLQVSKKEPSATDKLDGQIKITVKGGKAPYKLIIHTSTRTKELIYNSENEKFDIKELPKGFYLLNVTDSENNFTSQSVNL
ncbi:MAG TPA: hypothetical protein VNW06_11240 [Cytophagaceae bacterium]|jgi:hypothetical protein|nr:hypothetical protein [Cytophagaceae bacterium]